jgi:uncharacterized protein
MNSNIFKCTREVSWSVITGVVLSFLGTSLLNHFVLGRNGVFFSLIDITKGFIHPILLYDLIAIAILCIILFGWGHLKPREVGCVRKALLPALLFFLGFWIVAQVCFAFLSWISTGTLEWNIAWEQNWVAVIGLLIAHLFGTGIYEEVAFRGFMLPQLFLKFGGSPENQTRKHVLYAILVSQIVFSLLHIPTLLSTGANSGFIIARLGACLFLGMIMALLYMRSGNLFLIVGIHALIDTNTSLFNNVEDSVEHAVYAALMILVLIIWPVLRVRDPLVVKHKVL